MNCSNCGKKRASYHCTEPSSRWVHSCLQISIHHRLRYTHLGFDAHLGLELLHTQTFIAPSANSSIYLLWTKTLPDLTHIPVTFLSSIVHTGLSKLPPLPSCEILSLWHQDILSVLLISLTRVNPGSPLTSLKVPFSCQSTDLLVRCRWELRC